MPSRDKKRNRWRGQVRYQGKPYRADFMTKKEAVAWEAEKRLELEKQPEPIQTGMDLLTFFNKYLDFSELRFTKKVFKEKKALCLRVGAAWGNVSVEDISSEMVNDYLQNIARMSSANRHNKDRKNLLALWNWGVKIFDLQTNPVAKTCKLPHDRAPQYTPSTTDILKILQAAKPDERVFLKAYLHTGARRSEIFRLIWEDINFERREIRLGTRKTKDGSMSYESLPMSDELYKELWWWFQNRPLKDSPYVFPSTSRRPGHHFGGQYVERRWFLKTLCKRAGVKEFGFHALRRYVASSLADTHKISAKSIQRILRHKKLGTTEKYLESLHSDLRGIMNLLGTESTQEEHPNNIKGLGNKS